MEEAKPVVNSPTQDPNPNPNPPDTTPPAAATPQQQPSMPPPPPAAVAAPPPPPPPPQSKKRPFYSTVQIQECSYYKIRAVVRDIRPHILQVIRSVDFRSCKEAQEVKEKLKLLMELCKQMTAETATITRSKDAPEGQTLSSENEAGRKSQEQLQDGKPADQHHPDRHFAKPTENKTFQSVIMTEKHQSGDGDSQGTYIVGGSAFGWNFITFTGNKPTYSGRTKESFRAAQVTP